MTGTIITRTQHRCQAQKDKRGLPGKPMRVQWTTTPPADRKCPKCGLDLDTIDRQYVAVYRAAGKQRWKTFRRKKDAERHLVSNAKSVHDGTYRDVKPTPMATVFDQWVRLVLDAELATEDLKPSYVKSCKSNLKTHLRPTFDHVRSDQLLDAVPDWLRDLATKQADGTLARKTVTNIVGLLNVILEWAREPTQRYLANDPLADHRRRARKRKKSAAPPREVRHLEPIELHALLTAAADDPVAEMLLYLAAYSGLRRGELFVVQWDDLDDPAQQLRVRRSIYQGDITRPKTATSERRVDLPAPLITRLQAYRKTHPVIAPGYIFRRDDVGTPLDPDNWFKRVFVPIAIKAKLRPAAAERDQDDAATADETARDDRELVGLHTLRHTYASMLIAAGENFKYVSRQLGHANIQITLNTYSHLLKETSTSAMGRLAMRMPVAPPKDCEGAVA